MPSRMPDHVLAADVVSGRRAAISQAITLVESHRPEHRVQARELLAALPAPERPAVRVWDRTLLDPPVGHERVQVAADGGRRDAQPPGELARRLWTVLQQEGGHPVPRAPVVGGGRRTGGCSRNGFHNTIVTYFGATATSGVPARTHDGEGEVCAARWSECGEARG